VIVLRERGKDGGGKSILHQIVQFFLEFKGVYITHPSPTRREVCANLLSGKSMISPILQRKGGKDEV
jgi:hypothetical protein